MNTYECHNCGNPIESKQARIYCSKECNIGIISLSPSLTRRRGGSAIVRAAFEELYEKLEQLDPCECDICTEYEVDCEICGESFITNEAKNSTTCSSMCAMDKRWGRDRRARRTNRSS